ncbi:MAG: hypothetical protein ACE5HO_20180, partial [bacterium]
FFLADHPRKDGERDSCFGSTWVDSFTLSQAVRRLRIQAWTDLLRDCLVFVDNHLNNQDITTKAREA